MRWQRFHFEQDTSILTVLCQPEYAETGWKALLGVRSIIETFIDQYPEFENTHLPWTPPKEAPEIIQKMCEASRLLNVGPMAAIAGTLAEVCLLAILNAGSREAIVDNGGDIALFIRKTALIGIYSGARDFENLAFQIPKTQRPLGICTSSGKIGHSFSYGKTNAAIVFSENIPLADCAATALGNLVQISSDLDTCFNDFEPIPQITGAAAIFNERIGLYGKLPEIVQADVSFDLITRGNLK